MLIKTVSKRVSLIAVEKYLYRRLKDIDDLASPGHPWVFLAACTYIEVCASLANGRAIGKSEYKSFCKTYIFPTRPEYLAATYPSSGLHLEDQFYHILRCGVTHSFSLTPDPHPSSAKFNPTPRSILLAHKSSTIAHLSPIEIKPGIESYALIAEEFAVDLRKATKLLFSNARRKTSSGQQLRTNIVTRFKAHPPLGWTEYEVLKP